MASIAAKQMKNTAGTTGTLRHTCKAEQRDVGRKTRCHAAVEAARKRTAVFGTEAESATVCAVEPGRKHSTPNQLAHFRVTHVAHRQHDQRGEAGRQQHVTDDG